VSVVEGDRLVAVEPDPEHPTGHNLCVKGRAAPELVHGPERLLHPLRRTWPRGAPDPGWERIGWDEALDWTAARLRAVAAEHGPEAVAFAITTPSGTAMSDGLAWLERLVRLYGSPNIVYAAELCSWHRDAVTAYTFGADIGTPDLAHADCVLLWGHNPATSFLAMATAVAEATARGAALIVVDPRRAGLAHRARQWLRVRPGTDGALALGLAGVMLREGWYDAPFVRDWTTAPFLVRDDTGRFLTAADLGEPAAGRSWVAWDDAAGRPVVYTPDAGYARPVAAPRLRGAVACPTPAGAVTCRPALECYAALCAEFPPARVEALTGVPAAQVVETARLLWARRPVAYFHWNGLEQHTNASQTVRAIALLYALTGCLDAPGGNVRPRTPVVNDLAPIALLPEAQRAKALGRRERPLGPGVHGWVTARDVYRAILDGAPYRVHGLVGFGSNILLSQPDPDLGRAALERVGFLVYADLFMTPTAALADVVLPVASAWERQGLRVGFGPSAEGEGLIQLRQPAVPPRGEARSDTWIACQLALRLGLGDRFFGGDEDAGLRHVLEPTGITLEQLRARPEGVRVPVAPRHRRYAEPRGTGTRGFATPSRRVEIYAEAFLDHGQPPLPAYVPPAAVTAHGARHPLVLTSAKWVQFCHSQHRALPALRAQNPDPLVELHPEAAARRGIEPGDWVAIDTPRGGVRARARLNRTLAPDVVCAQFGWWQECRALGLDGYPIDGEGTANYNAAIGTEAADPISGTVPLRSYVCEVRRLAEA
jgi:anaerobic selenocysteine-containing dehydrogenase